MHIYPLNDTTQVGVVLASSDMKRRVPITLTEEESHSPLRVLIQLVVAKTLQASAALELADEG